MEGSRRSTIVNLSLVGLPLATIAAAHIIPAETQMRRNYYQDRAACERDYPPPPEQCDPPSNSSGHYYSGWHGPYYTANRYAPEARSDPGPGRTGTAPVSYETSTRGGFGAFGRTVRAVG